MKYLSLAILFISTSIFAQEITSKVGTIDIQFILGKMPEIEVVKTQVDNYSKTLEADLKKKVTALEEELRKYQEEENSLTINQRKSRQDSILTMEDDVNKFRQNANQLIGLKQEELMQPLYKKVGEILEKIAQEQNYTQVIQRNNDVVFIDNRFDLTLAILREMGIEVKPDE